MKKIKWLSLLLCLSLLLQCLTLPALAAETTQEAVTEEPIPTVTEPPFGTVCVNNGCRTIDGMVPLGSNDIILESSQGVFLYEMNTDTVVYSFNADVKMHPGSLAKILLALIVLEHCKLEDQVIVTEGIQSYVPLGAHKVTPTNLKSLEEVTVGDLLYAMLLINANDAAVALAHHVAGTTDAFLALMNARAKQLGCVNTEFGNISGLYTAVSYSTPREMAKITREAIKNEDFRKIFGAIEYTIAPTNMVDEEREFNTQNYMMDQAIIPDFYDNRVTGGMQSYHETTGASLVCTAESKSGLKYIAVILCATRTFAENGWQPINYGNFNDMTDLLSYGFDKFKVNRIIYDGMSLSQFSVAGGESNAVGHAVVDIDSVVPKSVQMDNLIMNFSVVNDGILTAPVKEGEMIATMELWYRSSCLAEAEVYAMGNVKTAEDEGVEIRSTAMRSDADASGFLSVLGTICVIVLGLAAAYFAFNAYMRSRIRAQRRRRRQNRRRLR